MTLVNTLAYIWVYVFVKFRVCVCACLWKCQERGFYVEILTLAVGRMSSLPDAGIVDWSLQIKYSPVCLPISRLILRPFLGIPVSMETVVVCEYTRKSDW